MTRALVDLGLEPRVGLRLALRLGAWAPFALIACAGPHPRGDLVPYAAAKEDLATSRDAPRSLSRPLLIIDGYRDPGLGSWWLERTLEPHFEDPSIFCYSFFTATSLEECVGHIIRGLETEIGTTLPGHDLRDVEFDVIGISMGGLVARLAAAPAPDRPSVRIKRLFTFSTPHRGALLAPLPFFDPLARQMRSDSEMIRQLDAALDEAPYEIIPYVRTLDLVVGTANASPYGAAPIVVPYRFPWPSHVGSVVDARIQADLIRRLRGDEPLLARSDWTGPSSPSSEPREP